MGFKGNLQTRRRSQENPMVSSSQTEAAEASFSAHDGVDEVDRCFAKLRAAARANPYPTARERVANLERLHEVAHRRLPELHEALTRDYGGRRARFDSHIGDCRVGLSFVTQAIVEVEKWMRPQRVGVDVAYKPASAAIHSQPKGVVGILSPWNYPVQLSLPPLASALAAGNRAIVKPSERAPHTAEVLKSVLEEALPSDTVAVVLGGVDVAVRTTSLPLDHILYTGGISVGREVMRAAAQNLVPVTLELGGKNPCIVHPEFRPYDEAARTILDKKLLNSGQICLAPDYLLIPRSKVDAMVHALQNAASVRFANGFLHEDSDYGNIIDNRAHRRLEELVDNAVRAGATVVRLGGAFDVAERSPTMMQPLLVLNTTDEMEIMQEEIFGPILPIIPYDSLDDAIAYVTDEKKGRPLALYYFDEKTGRAREIIEKTHSGGICVNDLVVHAIYGRLPFGGVGNSGMGAYHGKRGFDEFSHAKAVSVASTTTMKLKSKLPRKDLTSLVDGLLDFEYFFALAWVRFTRMLRGWK